MEPIKKKTFEMKKEIDEKTVKEKIERIKSVPQIGAVSREVQNILISSPKNEMSLGALRVIGHITTCLRNRQIKRGSKEVANQLSLFDDYWFDIENEKAIFNVQMSFLWKDFLPEGYTNYEAIRQGIRDLMKFTHDIRFERLNEKTGKMKKYRAILPFINGFVEEEEVGFKVSIPNYWYRLLINLSLGYNQYVRDIFLNVSSVNAISFYFYLKTLNKIETFGSEQSKEMLDAFPQALPYNRGTIKNIKEVYKMFNIKKIYWSDFERHYLEPIRNELYRKTDISFNYKLVGDNLHIITYESAPVLIEKGLYDSDTNKIRTAIKNKAQKYKLTKLEVVMLVELYLKYTYDIVYKATARKREINEFAKKENGTGKELIYILEDLCKQYVIKNNIPFYITEKSELGYDKTSVNDNFGYAGNKPQMRNEIRSFFSISGGDEDMNVAYGKERKEKIKKELNKKPIH